MTHYIDTYPNEVKIQEPKDGQMRSRMGSPRMKLHDWTKANNIIGWSWQWSYDENITRYWFKNKEDAILFQLTFG